MNTANTRVELRFDVTASRALRPGEQARLLDRLGPIVRVVASDTRSQARNRELALGRMRARLAEALRHQAPRRPTRPTAGSRRGRVEQKRRRAEIKRQRRRPGPDD